MQHLYSALIQELHQFSKKHQFQRAVIGLSGGLDSAVALCLAVRAFGARNVTALILPEGGLTPEADTDHARMLAKHFGCPSFYQPTNNFLVDFHFVPWEKSKEANESLKARVRSLLIRNYSESQNALFIGTPNRADLALGYGNADGEFAGELLILGDLLKTDILALAHFIGLPTELMGKTPSRHLHPNQRDEEDFGASWNALDEILKPLLSGTDPDVLIQKGMDSLLVHKLVRLLEHNKGKWENLPILKVSSTAEALKKAQAKEASSMS
jgi:NAD+ synthetase